MVSVRLETRFVAVHEELRLLRPSFGLPVEDAHATLNLYGIFQHFWCRGRNLCIGGNASGGQSLGALWPQSFDSRQIVAISLLFASSLCWSRGCLSYWSSFSHWCIELLL